MLSPEQQRWLFLWFLSFFYCIWKIPLSLSSPTMYLNLFFSVGGKKTHLPPSLHLGFCTTRQLTNQSVTWLIDCYQWVVVNKPDRKRRHTNAVLIHQPKKLPISKSVYYSFCPQGGWKFLNSSWVKSVRRFPVCPAATYFLQLFYMLSLLDGLRVRIGTVRYFSLLNIKQNPNLG